VSVVVQNLEQNFVAFLMRIKKLSLYLRGGHEIC